MKTYVFISSFLSLVFVVSFIAYEVDILVTSQQQLTCLGDVTAERMLSRLSHLTSRSLTHIIQSFRFTCVLYDSRPGTIAATLTKLYQ